METHPHRSYVTLWAERTRGGDTLMALPKFPQGKLWLPFCRFPESGSFSEAFEAVVAKYGFHPLGEPELIIRCYRKDSLMWRNVIFKTDIEAPDASVWHKTSEDSGFQRQDYRSTEFLNDRQNILSHRIMYVGFFKKPLTEDEQQLFESAAFTSARIDALCCILMDMIWPCELFDMTSFRILLRRLYNGGLKNTKALFRTCVAENGCFAEPCEVLKLLACLEPTSSGKTRFDFIFRFYAGNRSAGLSTDELEPLIRAALREDSSGSMAAQTRKFYADMINGESVLMEKFRNILASTRESLRRTKRVLRAPYSLFRNPNIDKYDGVVTVPTHEGLRPRNFPAHMSLTKRVLRVPPTAWFVDPLPWWRFYEKDSRSQSTARQDASHDPKSRLDSMSEPIFLLDDLKLYAPHDPSGCFRDSDLSHLAQRFMNVCAAAREIFETEPRLLLLESPVHIFGSLLGSYKDLLFFERAFWRLGPRITPSSFLFLGDYVGLGPSNLAVVGHLFACKILARKNFLLIRGMHEDRRTNETSGLLDECRRVFGKEGPDVYEAINSVFDVLPLAAIVDRQLFCVHGGIPQNILNPPYLGAINCVEVDLSNPIEDQTAMELIWNDPNYALAPEDDYAPKTAGGVGKLFSAAVMSKFLEQFNIAFVIRAQQPQRAGSDSPFSEHLISLNSSTETRDALETRTASVLALGAKVHHIQFYPTASLELLKSGI